MNYLIVLPKFTYKLLIVKKICQMKIIQYGAK